MHCTYEHIITEIHSDNHFILVQQQHFHKNTREKLYLPNLSVPSVLFVTGTRFVLHLIALLMCFISQFLLLSGLFSGFLTVKEVKIKNKKNIFADHCHLSTCSKRATLLIDFILPVILFALLNGIWSSSLLVIFTSSIRFSFRISFMFLYHV